MFKRWKIFLAKHLAPAEESGLYRAAVTVLVMFALVLTLHQIEWPFYWWAVLLITPAASYLSYRRRHSPNLEIKIFLSFAMIALLFWFFTRLASSLFDPRIPLAELLIWLQALHAFDLPAKKDLRYTVLVALILMAMASVLTYSSFFAVFVLVFCALFLVVAAIDFWSDNRRPGTYEARLHQVEGDVPSGYRIDRSWLGKTLLLAFPTAIVTAAVIFVFMPRFQGLTLRTMPLNWDIQFSLAHISEGAIVNQQLPSSSGKQSGQPQRISGDSYFGFDSQVNLNARGELSDRLVIKVRTSDWQYHRAVTFSEYTGGGWRSGLTEPRLKTIQEPPFYFQAVGSGKDRLTIYYAEVDLPNIVFTPQYPRTLYFPSSELYVVDSFSKVRRELNNAPAVMVSPFALDAGMVYSVLNRMPEVEPSQLKNLPSLPPNDQRWEVLMPYLQLPPELPARVRSTASQIVAGKSNPWEQATTLCTYLQQNYKYNLDVPFYPEGADTVDHFLFEAKEGYCEQFATSMCVMARSVGLPARYVTGYLPGTYNPLSGFYEIHANDAHAWVEVFIPGNGWTIFDPVPGGNANPGLGEHQPDGWLLESLFKYLGVPSWLRELAPNAIRVSIALALMMLAISLWKGRGTARKSRPSSALMPYLKRAEELTGPRRPGETVKNWALRRGDEPLLRLAEIYERTFYRDRLLSGPDLDALGAVLAALRQISRDTPDKAP